MCAVDHSEITLKGTKLSETNEISNETATTTTNKHCPIIK